MPRLFGHNGSGPTEPRLTEAGHRRLAIVTCDVALFGTARDLLPTLEAAVQSADTSTREGYTTLFDDALLLILRCQAQWKGGAVASQVVHESEAEGAFNGAVVTARARIQHEEVTNINGVRRANVAEPPPANEPAEDEAGGLTVTFVSAAPLHLEMPPALNAETLAAGLRLLASIPAERLEAAEIVWMPKAGEPLLSGDDLLRLFPHLQDL